MKGKNKRIWILISAILLVVVIAGTLVWFLMKDMHAPNKDSESSKEPDNVVTEEVEEEDGKEEIMILNCDSQEALEESKNIQLVTDEGLFVQGTGAYMNSSTNSMFFNGKLKNAVDITKYKGGYIHLSCYISTKANFKNDISFELSSAGIHDKKELQWNIELSKVKEGWNEIYLSIPDATKQGKIDMTAINYFRMYSTDLDASVGSLDVIIDDIKATKKKETVNNNVGTTEETPSEPTDVVETDQWQESTAKNGKMLASFNTKNIFAQSKNLEVTTKLSEHREGSGAMKILNGGSASFTWKTPVDISEYATIDGTMHISVYINDVANLTSDVYFYLSSSDDIEEGTFYWYLATHQFHSGWNEIDLPFYSGATKRNPQFNAMKYFSFHTSKPSDHAVIILDNMYVTK